MGRHDKRVEIIITGHYGGNDAGEAARRAVTGLKTKIRSPDEASCSVDLQIRVNLYVSGETTRFDGPSGHSNIRLYLAKGHIDCDVTMGTEIWMAGREAIIEFLTSTLTSATSEMSDKLRKRSVSLDAEALKAFFERAAKE